MSRNRCPSCGGVIGRDCYNPIECAQITDSMNTRDLRDQYNIGHHEGYKVGYAEASLEAQNELEQLRAWKKEAIACIPDWQEIGKLIGVSLGDTVSDKLLPWIRKVKNLPAAELGPDG